MKRLNSGMNGSTDEPLQLRQLNELKRRHYMAVVMKVTLFREGAAYCLCS